MISSPGDVSDRHRNSITPPGSGIRGGVIDPTGAQRPSEDREEDMVVRHAESPASTRPAVGIRGGKRPHLGADRVAGPDRVRKVDTLEGHGTGLRKPPGQPVGSARHGVLLGDDDGHTPQHRPDHTRNRGVTTEADNDSWSETTYQSDTGDDGGKQSKDRADVLQGQAALDPSPRQDGQREASLGNKAGLDTAGRADIVHLLRRHAAGDEFGGDRQAGNDVARRTAASDDRMGLCHLSALDGRRSSARPSRRGSPPSKSHQTTGTAGSHP